jgi:hypothetical protein
MIRVSSKHRLRLAKETLRSLSAAQLAQVGGATAAEDAGCVPPSENCNTGRQEGAGTGLFAGCMGDANQPYDR